MLLSASDTMIRVSLKLGVELQLSSNCEKLEVSGIEGVGKCFRVFF